MILDSHPFLIAATIQIFLYSLYLVSLVHALRWLLFEDAGWSLRSRAEVSWPLLAATLVIFVFSTADAIFEVSLQFTFAGDLEGVGSSVVTQQLIIASVAIETSTLLITDAVLIIRCWLLYQKSWRVVCLPFALWMTNVTCMVLWIASYTMSVFGEASTYKTLPHPSLQVFYSFNFATNLYATAAIVYRIWYATRDTKRRSSFLHQVFRTVAGTGILYTSSCLPLVVSAFFMGTNKPVYILCDAISFSFSGIAFNLLQIGVGQLRAQVTRIPENARNSHSSATRFNDTPSTAIIFDESGSVRQRSRTDDVKDIS